MPAKEKSARKRIAIIATAEVTIRVFLRGHLEALGELYDLTVFVNTNDSTFLSKMGIAVEVFPLGIARSIRPWSDVSCLATLIRRFLKRKYDAVVSVTPKAGLLAAIASIATRVPVRLHLFTGQVWATRRGIPRRILKAADQLVGRLTTDVLVDSESQRQFLIDEGVVQPKRSQVIAHGSISGVDLDRFRPDTAVRANIRKSFAIPDSARTLLFVGRLTRDKGILDLSLAASRIIGNKMPDVHLVIVGSDEGGLRPLVLEHFSDFSGNVHFVDFTDKPEQFMAAADILCLPSYREGFGSVVIEAAACGIPAVASRIYGLTDAVLDGVTGHLHTPGNVEDLVSRLTLLLENPEQCARMGSAARIRAASMFRRKDVTEAFVSYIRQRMN